MLVYTSEEAHASQQKALREGSGAAAGKTVPSLAAKEKRYSNKEPNTVKNITFKALWLVLTLEGRQPKFSPYSITHIQQGGF